MSAHRTVVAWVLAAAVLSMAGGLAPAAAQDLGRLFLTPEERARLDDIRYAPDAEPPPEAPAPEVAAAEPSPPPAPPMESFRMDGMVVRSRGPSTAWVDGDRVLRTGRMGSGLTVDPRGDRAGVTVTLPDNARVTLKPGQAFVPEGGGMREFSGQGRDQDQAPQPEPGPGTTVPAGPGAAAP